MSFQIMPSARQGSFAGGINDQGVSFTADWLTGTDSPAAGKEAARTPATNDLGAWALGNFKTVAEVNEAMTSDQTAFWVPVSRLDPSAPLPLHHAIHDKTGNSDVVEFTPQKSGLHSVGQDQRRPTRRHADSPGRRRQLSGPQVPHSSIVTCIPSKAAERIAAILGTAGMALHSRELLR